MSNIVGDLWHTVLVSATSSGEVACYVLIYFLNIFGTFQNIDIDLP